VAAIVAEVSHRMTDSTEHKEAELQPPASPSQPETSTEDTGIVDTLLKIAHEEDANRFGCVPAPDYDFWARKSAWTPDQAVALSLAKDPTIISWNAICIQFPNIIIAPCHLSDYTKFSRFALTYRLRRELLLDNIAFGKIGFIDYDQGWITPIELIDWIRLHDLWAPSALSECVQKYHVDLIDWQQEAFRLKQDNERLSFELSRIKSTTEEPHPKARSTFQKMILAMVMSQYKWGRDPSAVGRIVKAIDNLGEGISLTDDAVRGALKDAAQALDVQTDKIS